MKKKLLLVLGLVALVVSIAGAQNAIVGDGFSTGWGGGSCPTGNGGFSYMSASAGSTYIVTRNATGTGNRFFRFGIDWSGTTAQRTNTPTVNTVVSPNTTYTLNSSCTTSGALQVNVASTAHNYVFKTLNAGTNPTGTWVFFLVQGTVQSVSSVTQSPTAANVFPGQAVTVTANLSGAFATGQGVYLRYTTNNYTTSTVVQMTGSGTTYTATIPASVNTAGAGASYYVFTSGDTGPAADGSNADLYTINLNNNAGANYTYTVASGWTTAANGNWGTAATWTANAVPPTTLSMGTVNVGHNVTGDANAIVGALNVNGTSTLTQNAGISLQTTGAVTIAAGATYTVNGSLQINAGGFVNSTGTLNYGTTSTLIYNAGGTYGVSNEWSANASSGPRVPANVTIGNGVNTTLSFGTANQFRQARGSVTIATGSGLTLSTALGGDIRIGGDFTNNGTFTHSSRSVEFNGTAAQAIAGTFNGTTTTNRFAFLTISNTTAPVTANTAVNAATTGSANSFTINANATYVQAGGILTVQGAASTVTFLINGTFIYTWTASAVFPGAGSVSVSATGTYVHNSAAGIATPLNSVAFNSTSTMIYRGSSTLTPALSLSGRTYGHLRFESTSGTWSTSPTIGAGNSCTSNDFFLGTGVTINCTNIASTAVLNVSGNLTTNGTIVNTSGFSNFTLTGVGRTISGSTNANYDNLILNSPASYTLSSNSPVIVASGTCTVNNGATLDFGVSNIVSGSGGFTAATGATLITANTAGFNTTGATGSVQTTSRTFTNAGVNYTFNGTAAQNTGTAIGAATNIRNLVINNAAGVTLSAAITLSATGTLTFTNGLLSLSTFNATMTSGALFSGVTSARYVRTNSTGQLRQTVGGTAVSFPVGNSAYNPISITNTGTSDVYGIRVVDGAVANAFDNTLAVNRAWVISEVTAGGSTLSVVPQYNTGEEGTNFNAGTTPYIGFWNGSSPWTQVSATLAGSNPFTATAGSTISPTNLTTGTQYFAVGKDAAFVAPSTNYTWNGSQAGGLWTNTLNWTPNGTPGSADNVIIPTSGSYTNPLNLTVAVTVNNFETQGDGTFTMSAAGSLTVSGNLTNGTTATPSFDCASTFAIAGTSAQTIPAWNFGNLNASGGNRTLSSTGTIGICGTFTPGAGVYTITGSTVNFNGTGAQTVNAINYNNLTISGNRGGAAITLPSGTIGVAGALSVTASNNTWTTTGNTVDFNGTGTQTVAAFANYNNLTISGARGGATVTLASGTIGVGGVFNPSATSVTYNSTGNTFDYTSTGAQTIVGFNRYNNLSNSGNGARTLANTPTIVIDGTYTPTTGAVTVGTSTVDFSSASAQNFPATNYYNVTNTGNGDRTWASSGTIDIASNFTPSTGTNTITGSTVRRSSTAAGPFSIGAINTEIAGSSYYNLTIAGSDAVPTVYQLASGASVGVAATFTLTSGFLRLATTFSSGTFTVNGAALLNGGNLNLTNSGNVGDVGTLNFAGDVTLAGTNISRTSSVANGFVNFNRSTGTQTLTYSSGSFSFSLGFAIPVNVGTGTSTNTLVLGASASLSSITLAVLNNATLDFGTFNLSGGMSFNANSGSTLITANTAGFAASGATGSVQSTGARTFNAGANFVYDGTAAQVTGTALTGAANLTIDNTANVTLTSAATVSGILALTNGRLIIGSNNLTVSNSATGAITGTFGAANMVVADGTGQLLRAVATGANTYTWPIGDGSGDYSPVQLAFSANATAGNVGWRVTDAGHPNDGTTTDRLTRYWTSTQSSLTTYTYTPTFTYNVAGDVVGTEANILLNRWGGALPWTEYTATTVISSPTMSVSTPLDNTTGSLSATAEWVGRVNVPILTYTWDGSFSTDWDDAANWDLNAVPSLGTDIIVIPTSGSYTNALAIDGARTVDNFTVNGDGVFSMGAGSSLTVQTAWSYNSTGTSTFACNSTLTIAGSGSQTIPALAYGNLNLTGGPRVLASSGTIGICGTFTPGAGAYTVTGSTVDFNGTGTQTINAFNYNNLTISGARGGGDITLASGTIGVAGTYSTTATGFGSVIVTGNTVNFSSASSQPIPAFFYNNITNTGNGPRVWANSGTIDVFGSFTPGTGTHTITGSTWRYSSTTASAVFTLSGFTTNLAGRNYNNLEIVGGTGSAFNCASGFNLGVAGNFSLTGAATFRVTSGASASNVMTVDGNVSVSGTGNLVLSGTTTNATTATLNVTGSTTVSSGALQLVNTSATTAHAIFTTNNLTIDNTGAMIMEVTGTSANANVTVNGNLLVTSTATNAIDLGQGGANASNIINLKGNFTKSGTGTLGFSGTFAATAGYFFNGTGTQQWSHSGTAMTAGSVTVAAGSTAQLQTNIAYATAAGAHTITVAGTLDCQGFSITAGNAANAFALQNTGTLRTAHASGVGGALSGFTVANVTFTGSVSTSGGASFVFAGTAQNTGFTPYTSQITTNNYNITWQGATSLTFDQTLNLNSFSFTNAGLIYLGNFSLQLSSVATLSGAPFSATKMFVTNGTGRLVRAVQNTGTGLPFTWPIGEDTAPNTDYSPVTISSIASAGISGNIGFRVVDGTHPNMSPANNYLTRYWNVSVTSFNTGYTLSGVSLTYDNANDVVNGPESALRINSWNSATSTWTEYTSTVTSPSISTNGISGTSMPTTANYDLAVRVDVPLYYRTVSSGAWTTLTNWEASTSPTFTSPFTPGVAPNATNSALIRVQATHAMTLTADLTVDDLEVYGSIDQQGAFTLTLNNGSAATDATIFTGGLILMSANSSSFSIPSGAVLLVNGTLRVSGTGANAGGTISGAAGSTITMANGSVYDHNRDGGSLRMGSGTLTWQTGSTCQLTGQTTTNVTASSYNQAFSNFIFNCAGLSATGAQAGSNLVTVNGNLRILSTGTSGGFNLSNGVSYTLNVGGNIQVEGGTLRWSNGGANTATCTINITGDLIQETSTLIVKDSPMNLALTINGNFTQNGGTFDFSTSGSTTNTLTLRGNFRQDGVLQRGGGTTTFNFHRTTSGTQTWTQAGTVAASSATTWNIGNGTNANTVQLLSNINLGASGHPGFNVNNNSTFDMQGFVLSGTSTVFTAQTGSTLRIGHPEGISPNSNTTQGNVRTGGTKTFNSDVFYVYTGTNNQVTGLGLPAQVRTLTIANTGTAPNNVVTLSANTGNFNNSTPTFFLELTSGRLDLNGFTIAINSLDVRSTGGDFTGTTGRLSFNGGLVETQGTMNIPNVLMTAGSCNFGLGANIVTSFQINGGNVDVAGSPPVYLSGSTLIYNATTYGRFREWTANVLSGAGYPWNVQIGNGTNCAFNLSNSAPINMGGSLTVSAGSSFTMNEATTPRALTVGGNVVSPGTLTLGNLNGGNAGDINVAGNWNVTGTFNNNSRAVFFNGTANQDILSSNTFAFVFINNTAGVSLQANTTVSNNLTFSNGLLNLGNFNLTMQSGASFSGATSARYARTNGTGRMIQTVGGSNVFYPVGRSAYNPVTLNNSGTSDTYGVILNDGATGFENNPNRIVVRHWDVNEGTAGGSNLTVTAQWNAPVAQAGEEASQFVRNDPSRTIGVYSSGAWTEGSTATLAGTNPYTYTSGGFTSVGLFVPGIGDAFRAEPYIATVSSMSGYTGDVIQFTGSNLATVTNITFGGTAATINTLTQTATFVEATITTGSSGDIVVTNPVGSTALPGWTYLGYITDTNGDWNTPSVWRGGNVPPAGALTTINNTNTVNGAVLNAPSQVTINSARSLTLGAGGSLNATTVINSSGTVDLGSGTLTIAAGGTVTNNGSFSGGTAGTLVFAGAGTLAGGTVPTLRNFTINGGATLNNAPQILGTFLINNGGFVTAAPTYGLNSTLQYNTGSTYGRNLEWSTTTGAGYPANVQISGNTTLDLGNGGAGTARAISGSLTIDSNSSLSMNVTPMSQALTVNGNVLINGTLVLSSASGGDIIVNGNWTRNTGGTFTDNSRAVFLRGTAAQTITGPTGGNSFSFLLIDKTGGSVTLANDVTITNTFTFTAINTANVITGANALVLSSTATGALVRTGAGYVNGTLRRGIASGTNVYDYPVGGSTVYAPVSISANGVTGTGNLAVRSVDGEHPNIASSGINNTLSVNRYWTITPTMLSAASISPIFNFVSGDVDGGANTANFIIQRREIGIWSAVSVGTRTATSTQGVNVGGYGDFAIGECREPNSYSVTGGGSYCSGGAGVAVGLSGSDAFATYQLRLDGTNIGSPVAGTGGAITFGNQTPAGNYTVVATSIGSTCSAQMNGSAIVTITNPVAPQVTISVSPGATICVGASATFTAVPTNGGLTPTYQWRKNGLPVGTGGTTYTDGSLVNGDVITVVMTSSLTCVTTSTATSNALTMTVTTPSTWYRDLDGDGFGDVAVTLSNCGQPVGYVANNTDCDDTSPVAAERFPGNDEFCDNVDNDCNSLIDDGLASNIYYQDLDGDGRGNPAVQQIACAVPAGYVTNANDCNDACALCYVGAPEIADGLDNDCDLAVDEGFGPINDFRSNALVAVQSTYGLPCTPVTGTLLGATVSPESTTGTTVTGEDVWYYFTAVDTAYSITVTTTNYNLRIELHDDTNNPPNVTLRDAENFSSSVGTERLNYIGLIPGRTYFICVRNVNTAQTVNPASGQFQLCVNPLPRGGYNGGFGNNGPYTVNHNLCDVVNARFTRANQYRFEFRDLITNATYNGITANNSTLMAFNSIAGLIPGRQYELRIFSIYNTMRGDNTTPDIVECPPLRRPFIAANPPSIPQALPALNYTATITVNPHANLAVRSLDVCPTNRLLTQWIAAEPNICAAQFYEWRFTRVLPSPGLPINWTSPVQFSRWVRLQDVPGLQAGATYDVEIRPIFTGGFAGAWSTVPSCVRTIGPAMPLFRDEEELSRPEERSLVVNPEESVRANVFPNPTTGEVTMLEVMGYTGQVQLTIYNSAGQLVYTRNHDVADGEMVPIDLQQVLSNGLYNVIIHAGDRQIKRKLMVAR